MGDSWILRMVPMLVVSLLVWSSARVVVQAQVMGPSVAVHESFGTESDVRISLTNVSGRILVSPSNGNVVDIRAIKHAADDAALAGITVAIDKGGSPVNDVRIRTQYAHYYGHGGSVDYTLTVPRHAVLRLTNVTGNIVANGFANDMTLNDVSGDVSAETDGNVKAHTVNGAIVVSVTRFPDSRSVALHTVSGAISLTVPHDAGAVVKAQSMSGGFQSDFPLTVKSEMIGSRVNGRIGNGAGWIELETVSGMLEIKSAR
jgi:DUF4097 and DUF4098 domain-containing protein YvlB